MLKGYVEIERLSLQANHGVLPQERLVGNRFEVSLTLEYDMERAAVTDDVAFALDYSKVAGVVREVMAEPSALLENVLLRMRDRIKREFPAVLGGKIKLAKVTPPIPARMESVAVTIGW
ncbi:MAG: dihydroneopterin aldolase [Muribaculaceae bacterium]|nr:dihydroneopterin aldolase [Muribaculaceae bacterium]